MADRFSLAELGGSMPPQPQGQSLATLGDMYNGAGHMLPESTMNPNIGPGAMILSALGSLASLPRRAIEASAGDVQHLGDHSYAPQSIGPAMETAMTMMGAGVPMAERGAAGVFGGKLAKTADTAALSRAEQLTAKGATPDDVWRQTGWFKGAGDRWLFEIPDDGLKVGYGSGQGLAGGAVQHPEALAAYPQLADTRFSVAKNYRAGHYQPSYNSIRATGENVGEVRSVVAHELQHAIDDAEGALRTANAAGPDMARTVIDRLNPSYATLGNAARAGAADEAYKRLVHETLARNAERRLDLTPTQRRATSPMQTQDRPYSSQIPDFAPDNLSKILAGISR